jgi:hypothetical protein
MDFRQAFIGAHVAIGGEFSPGYLACRDIVRSLYTGLEGKTDLNITFQTV